MPFLSDDANLEYLPKRIVSLVPSQTELLFDLGLEEEVVGITKFCIHPAKWFATKKRVGGTKNIHIDQVVNLKPDLILANKEENTKEQIAELAEVAPLWMSDIQTLPDALSMIHTIGKFTGKDAQAQQMVSKIQTRFNELRRPTKGPKVVYLIWQNPWMAVAADTFINDLLERGGCLNVLNKKSRYPQLTDEELIALNPDWVMLSSEPYPFKASHKTAMETLLPKAKVSLVDGELMSWYGSRLLQTPAYWNQLIATQL